ncbi:ABC transporter permease [Bacteroides sp. 519]|uniref:ABC transporter permease n=1 Tax=Bacteroides sp. 519 TaxID=2302937 RepID=UPI0013D05D09|nr:FtsX-like permease family protein [Bacteroides sp. 519]NDV58862.1 ABC transporter permease [Bacteroides sp. 519]
MKQLYYTLMTLLRGRSSNIIKVISLTLGLFIGIILFARVAFELSYNKGYKESDKLAVVMATYTSDGMPGTPMKVVMGPVPETIMKDFPDEVECATLVQNQGEVAFFLGEQRHVGNLVMADTLFFRTVGITVTSGQEIDLSMIDMAFISEDFAKCIFGTTDVIGKTVMRDKNKEITIRGTYLQVEDNNSIRPDIVVSIAGWSSYRGWGGGDSFQGFVRLRQSSDIEKVNKRMDAVIDQYMKFDPETKGWGVRYHLENICKEHIENPNVKRLVTIMSFLAVAILLIAAMNYILIAISSLSRRAKGVGVHKCNGATSTQVFVMFLWETAIIILVSLMFASLLIFNLRGLIEDIIEVNIESLFTLQTLWVPLLIIAVIFIVAGVIPGRIFSHIPVTQVFRKYTERNSSWKRVLLFIQFVGVSFVFGLLVVVFVQYERVMNFDLGYQPRNIATSWVRMENPDIAVKTIENFPMVEKAALSWLTVNGYSGDHVKGEDGKMLFSTRFNIVTPEFIPLYGFQLLEGRNVMAPNEVVVNEEYVKRMPWTDGAIGKQSSSGNSFGIIVGVMKDFVDSSLFQEKNPVAFATTPKWHNSISVKLKEPFNESLMNLNKEVAEVFPNNNILFSSLEKDIESKYVSVRRFRDSAIVAFIGILLITLMGLFGYINDEIQRRSKEIAIRKVNGAEAWNVLKLLSREVSLVAIPAIVLGIIVSYFIGQDWLDQFAGTRIELSIAMYALLSIVILAVIIISVILKSWRVANENPVNSIKSE